MQHTSKLELFATVFEREKKRERERERERERGRKEMFYLMTHLTHFIYGYMISDIRQRTTQIVRERKPAAWTTPSS